MLISMRQVELSGDDLVGLRVPADDGLGASAAGRTADIQNFLGDLAEFAAQCAAGVFDEMRHVERHRHGRCARFGDGRLKLKSAHRATADIHETLQRCDLFGSCFPCKGATAPTDRCQMRTSTTLRSAMLAVRSRRSFACARRTCARCAGARRPFALSAFSLGRKQCKRPRGIRRRYEGFQTVQQIERPQQRHQIAQGDGAGFFEPLERRQTNAALMRQFDLGQGRALR